MKGQFCTLFIATMLNNLVLSKLNDFHPIKQIGHNQPCMNTIQLQFYTGTEIILVVTCQGSWNTIFVQGINAVHHYKSLCNGIVRASLNPFIFTFVSYSAKLCQIIYKSSGGILDPPLKREKN